MKKLEDLLEENRALDARLAALIEQAHALEGAGAAADGNAIAAELERLAPAHTVLTPMPIYAVRG